jgi:hypothetical protein
MGPSAVPDPLDALRHAARPAAAPPAVRPAQRLVVAGAGGPLGRAVLERALGDARWAGVAVLTGGPLQPALRGLHPLAHRADADDPIEADVALVVFDRGRDVHGRDAAYHLPEPAELPRLARRLRAGGVHTLAVLWPVAPAGLPHALQHGLATLDEQAVAGCGFERLLLVRPAQAAGPDPGSPRLSPPERLARWMLSQLRLMTPAREQPVRAASVAAFVSEVLRRWPDAPPGTRVAAAPLLWEAAQAGPEAVVRDWLSAAPTAPPL